LQLGRARGVCVLRRINGVIPFRSFTLIENVWKWKIIINVDDYIPGILISLDSSWVLLPPPPHTHTPVLSCQALSNSIPSVNRTYTRKREVVLAPAFPSNGNPLEILKRGNFREMRSFNLGVIYEISSGLIESILLARPNNRE
jgi:hypothetical protein